MLLSFNPSPFTLPIHGKKLLKKNKVWARGFPTQYPSHLLPPDISSLTPQRLGLSGKGHGNNRFLPYTKIPGKGDG